MKKEDKLLKGDISHNEMANKEIICLEKPSHKLIGCPQPPEIREKYFKCIKRKKEKTCFLVKRSNWS